MKKLLILVALFIPFVLFAQNFNADNTALANFITRMYKHASFDVKVVQDYEKNFLVSAVVLEPSKYGGNESTMTRVASVKATSQASRYFNGSNITDDLLISTTEKSDGTSYTAIIEKIRENVVGYVNKLEQLANFETDEGKKVFLYFTRIE